MLKSWSHDVEMLIKCETPPLIRSCIKTRSLEHVKLGRSGAVSEAVVLKVHSCHVGRFFPAPVLRGQKLC